MLYHTQLNLIVVIKLTLSPFSQHIILPPCPQYALFLASPDDTPEFRNGVLVLKQKLSITSLAQGDSIFALHVRGNGHVTHSGSSWRLSVMLLLTVPGDQSSIAHLLLPYT